jgi:hypothetical protein
MKLFDFLEKSVNRVSDMDSSWGPFSFLRPQIDETFTLSLAMKLGICFCPFPFLLALVLQLSGGYLNILALLGTPLVSSVVIFLTYGSFVRYFWNRRARRLRGQRT